MSSSGDESSNIRTYAGLVLISILIVSSVYYYAEYREINDPYDLAGRIIHVSGDISSYQFNMTSNISILGETFSLLTGNGYVGYTDEEMSIAFLSSEGSIEMIVVDETAYMRENDGMWDSRDLDERTWQSNDQLSQNEFLLEESTHLSMERTDGGIVLTAVPDHTTLIEEAEKVGLDLQGDERLNDYYVRYLIDEDTYRILSIETYIDLQMKVQGMNSPVIINNRIDIHDYDREIDVEAPL